VRDRAHPQPERLAGELSLRCFVHVAHGVPAVGRFKSSDTASNGGTLAETWNGTTWTIDRTPDGIGASFSQLDGVSCPSATACVAVGDYVSGLGNPQMLAEAWNGKKWAIEPTLSPTGLPGQESVLTGVSCASAMACTAVGWYTVNPASNAPDQTLAEVWNENRWAIGPTPNRPGVQGSVLSAVSCTSAVACTAVGSGAGPLAEAWNENRWAIEPTPSPKGASLNDLSCTSATACVAVGSSGEATLAERFR